MTTSALIRSSSRSSLGHYIYALPRCQSSFTSSTVVALSITLNRSLNTLSCIQHRDRVDTACTTPVSTFNIEIESLNSPTDLHLRTRKPRIESCNAFLPD